MQQKIIMSKVGKYYWLWPCILHTDTRKHTNTKVLMTMVSNTTIERQENLHNTHRHRNNRAPHYFGPVSVQCWHLVVIIGCVTLYTMCGLHMQIIPSWCEDTWCLQVDEDTMTHNAEPLCVIFDYTHPGCNCSYIDDKHTTCRQAEPTDHTHTEATVSGTASGFTNNPLRNRKQWRQRNALSLDSDIHDIHQCATCSTYCTCKVNKFGWNKSTCASIFIKISP